MDTVIPPLVTIYIPCRDYGKYLEQAIESVLTQSFQDWYLYLIDDGSIDDTSLICSYYQSKYKHKITYLKNNVPLGLQKVANHILPLICSEFIMRLDADDWLEDYALLLMIDKFKRNPRLGLVYGNYFYTNINGRVLGMERRLSIEDEDHSGNIPPHGACTMVRTRSLKSVGGYSQSPTSQDGWDLWYKLYKRVDVSIINAPLFYYRQHNSSLSRDNNRLLKSRSAIFQSLGQSLQGDYKPRTVGIVAVQNYIESNTSITDCVHNGLNLLESAILKASEIKAIDILVVSSDSQYILDFSKDLELSGRVPQHFRVIRDHHINSQVKLPIKYIWRSTYDYLLSNHKISPDILFFFNLYSVHCKSQYVQDAYNLLLINESDTVVSVDEINDPVFKYGKRGLDIINLGRIHNLAYDRERLFRFNGAFIGTWSTTLQLAHEIGEKISFIEMSPEDSVKYKVRPKGNS